MVFRISTTLCSTITVIEAYWRKWRRDRTWLRNLGEQRPVSLEFHQLLLNKYRCRPMTKRISFYHYLLLLSRDNNWRDVWLKSMCIRCGMLRSNKQESTAFFAITIIYTLSAATKIEDWWISIIRLVRLSSYATKEIMNTSVPPYSLCKWSIKTLSTWNTCSQVNTSPSMSLITRKRLSSSLCYPSVLQKTNCLHFTFTLTASSTLNK